MTQRCPSVKQNVFYSNEATSATCLPRFQQ